MIRWVIAPVGKSTPYSKSNFQFELSEAKKGNVMMWDEDRAGSVQVGDRWVFADGGSDTAFITKVIGVSDTSTRRPHWGTNRLTAKGAARRSIILDPTFVKFSLQKLLTDAGYKRKNFIATMQAHHPWPYPI